MELFQVRVDFLSSHNQQKVFKKYVQPVEVVLMKIISRNIGTNNLQFTVSGSHQDPQNKEHWQVGCLGITAPCSQECEVAFMACVEDQNPEGGSDRVTAFQNCMDLSTFEALGCDAECAPTYNMLTTSEMPTVAVFDNFGAGSDSASERPDESLCIATSN